MGVKLGIAGGQLREQSENELLVHARILEQPKHPLRVTNTRLPKKLLRSAGEEFKNHHVQNAEGPTSACDPCVEAERITREANRAHACARGIVQHEWQNRWMQV